MTPPPPRLADAAGSAGAHAFPPGPLDVRLDPLTRVASRREALSQLGHALVRVDSTARSIAVLLVDLDGFRRVNRDRGHGVGDELLFSAARRIVSAVGPGDVVGRAGGDEFVVIRCELGRSVDAASFAQRILAAFDDPFDLGGEPFIVTASVGVAIAEDGAARPEALLGDAEVALDRNPTGTRRFEFFDPVLRARIEMRTELAGELEIALRNDCISLAYQPIVDIASGRIAGVEALARWRDGDRGPISPELFVSVAEGTSLADELLARVLDHAATDFVQIAAADPTGRITLAVNVSASQLLSDSLPPGVERLIERSGVAPERIVIEISESALGGEADRYRDRIVALRGLGARISLDDFGTASTSIAQLRALPIDQIKLDRSFVGGLGDGSADAALAAGLLPLARALEIEVVAEGIETDQHLAHLFALGYRWGQGFRFAVPEPVARVVALIRSGEIPSAYAPESSAWGPEHERFRQALLLGDAKGAERVVAAALAEGVGAMAIQTEIIGRALHWVDSEWEAGRLDAADQHLAAAICERQLTTVLNALRPGRRRFARRVLFAAVGGHAHGAALKSAADDFGTAGYETVFLGTDVHGEELAAASGTHHPGALCLTLTEPDAGADLDAVLERLSVVPEPPLVLVGGLESARGAASRPGAIPVSSPADALDVLARELDPLGG